jgi:hypothetical protein
MLYVFVSDSEQFYRSWLPAILPTSALAIGYKKRPGVSPPRLERTQVQRVLACAKEISATGTCIEDDPIELNENKLKAIEMFEIGVDTQKHHPTPARTR